MISPVECKERSSTKTRFSLSLSFSRNKTQRGIFPKSYVQLVETEVQNGELFVRRSDFVKEISTVLNDWRNLFTHFYLSSDCNFQQLRNKILELIRLRSQILTGNLPVDELKEVKLLATSVIDTGNSLLGLDMIVRDEAGNVLDIGRTSTTHLYEQHVNAETRIRKANVRARNTQNALTDAFPFRFIHFLCRVTTRTAIRRRSPSTRKTCSSPCTHSFASSTRPAIRYSLCTMAIR